MAFVKKKELVARKVMKREDGPIILLEYEPRTDERQPAKRVGVFYDGKLKFIIESGALAQFRPKDGTVVEVHEIEEEMPPLEG